VLKIWYFSNKIVKQQVNIKYKECEILDSLMSPLPKTITLISGGYIKHKIKELNINEI